ncbi:MAG: SIMPL domain-containing protein [candidate division WOR-3 bacterium]|nr:MAG: SIMPL domain-containing protein [candidate division WOR-3 bacterium]
MNFIILLSLIAQQGSIYPVPAVNIDQPVIQVTGTAAASISDQTTTYEIILYADTFDEEKEEAREKADLMKNEILKKVNTLGGEEKNMTLTNLNTLEPIENDPYFRVEQDIQILLYKVMDINKAKEQFLMIDGVQIGSVNPIMGEMSDYRPAIAEARQTAVKNAEDAATALAIEMNVVLGEPVYVAEHVTYPSAAGYEGSMTGQIIVTVTVCYEMIRKK